MAPKKPTKTGGKAGAVPGRPGKPMAGLRDTTVRVPAAFNAKTVDPTNQRGAGQRITGGLAGGRAGKPAGKIAGQAPKPAATKPAASAKPVAKPSGQFKAPSVPKPGTATKPQGTPQAQKWVRENTQSARVNRAIQAQNKTKIGKGGAAVLGLQAVSAVQDRFLSPRQLANKREFENYDAVGPMLKKLGVGGKPAAKGAKPAASTSKFAGARDKAMAKAKAIKGSPVLGPKKVGSGGSGNNGTIAQAFDKSFAAARKAGKATFMFRGKKYTTEMT
jgi:hypothetical protein